MGGQDLLKEIKQNPPHGGFWCRETEVPGEANTQVVVVVPVGMVVVDIETLAVEVAHIDAVAIGVENLLISIQKHWKA